MSRRQSYAKPGDPRYVWPASSMTPPLRAAAPALDTAWRGTLDRLPDGALLGELQDMHGWTLTIVGTALDRDSMSLRAWARTPGLILPAMDDRGLRSDLTDRLAASWPWSMARAADDTWRGGMAGPSWRLVVTGTRVSAGRLALAATMEAR